MLALVTSAARGILHELNPEIPSRFRTFSQIYSASLGSRRFNLVSLVSSESPRRSTRVDPMVALRYE